MISRHLVCLGAGALATLALFGACSGPEGSGTPQLILHANPKILDGLGQVSEISIEAIDEQGKPGEGDVNLEAKAQGFDGFGSANVRLKDGRATVNFSCLRATDANCHDGIRINAQWKSLDSSVQVFVAVPVPVIDGGPPPIEPTDAGPDAGIDGGPKDGGLDGGQDAGLDAGLDAGTDAGEETVDSGVYQLDLQVEKSILITGTGDNSSIDVLLTQVVGGLPADAGTPVTFTTTRGSFSSTPGLPTKVVNTGSYGDAGVVLHVAGAAPGNAKVTVTAQDARRVANITFLGVANISYVADPATKALLGLQSSGRETTTPISFKVIDSAQTPVTGIDVLFEVSGVAGASVIPTGTTNDGGIVTTTLQSGDTVGIATVRATVTATKFSTPPVTGTHPGTPIVGGKPSERGFKLSCEKYVLPALEISNAPPRYLTSDCTATLVDRFSNPVGLKTSVQWYSEAGSVNNPVFSTEQNTPGASGSVGLAKTTFSTFGAFPPLDVPPLLGEPSHQSNIAGFLVTKNPRDMYVTLIAVTSGEEDFYDNSGVDGGATNGKWDPGEWFVDLPEPFVDSNDNQQWDPGEFFIDTERVDCANPTAPQTRNNQWDGPNGCWDANTQIWRPIHLIYNGPLWNGPDPILRAPSGYSSTLDSPPVYYAIFSWGDDYFNPTSSFSPKIDGVYVGSVGTVKFGSNASSGTESLGAEIDYGAVEATETSPGVFAIDRICDPSLPAPPASTSSPVATRCLRRYSISNFFGGSKVGVELTPPTASTSGFGIFYFTYESQFAGKGSSGASFGVNFNPP